MAVFQCSYRSKIQGRSVFFNVIVPEQCEKDIPVAYMLHGVNASHFDWLKALSIERYATARDIAIVMPNSDNSCYADMEYGFPHYSFIINELIPYTRKMFNLSDKREKTFIGGFSMGGQGCLKIGLRNPEIFGAIGAMSCGFQSGGNPITATMAFGKDYKDKVIRNENDVFYLVDQLKDSTSPKPWIYHCCGTEDAALEKARAGRDHMEGKGFHYVYEEWAGAHTWDFWDEALPKILDFFQEYMHENNVEQYLNDRIPSSVVRKVK